jgi:hypothetical protein
MINIRCTSCGPLAMYSEKSHAEVNKVVLGHKGPGHRVKVKRD